MMQAINRHRPKEFKTSPKITHWGKRKTQEGPTMTVLIYVKANKKSCCSGRLPDGSNNQPCKRSYRIG